MTEIHKPTPLSGGISCALCLFAAIFLGGCVQEEKKELKAPLRSVRSMIVDQGSGIHETSFSGRLHAVRETSLSFKIAGTIRKIPVRVGDPVKKGEVIALLDPSTYALETQQAKAALDEARSELRNAGANYARVKKLYEGGNVSRSELDNARASYDSTAAAVQAAQKKLELARLNLSYTKLRAEEDCAVASVDAEEGENVAVGTQIFYTTCGRGLEVKLDIPESVIGNIKKDMPVGVTFSALQGKTYAGRVDEVGVSSVKGGTTFPVTVLMADPGAPGLKAGLSADVTFSIENRDEGENRSVVVPPFVVGEDRMGRHVFVLKTGGNGRAVVRRQPVTVGRVLATGIEVVEGIAPGMRVVTAGVSVLRDGMEVKYGDE